MQYRIDYFGFVYLWYDRHRKMFCLGSHHGSALDSYRSSTGWMNIAYRKRPQDFKRRILQYNTIDDMIETRRIEQMWLNLIKDNELSISENVVSGTNRYYNQKKNAFGGSHKGHKKTKKRVAHNKGIFRTDPRVCQNLLCGKEYRSKIKKQQYCSVKCAKANMSEHTKHKIGTSKKSMLPWNLGKKTDKLVIDKLKKAKCGRHRIYNPDGTWILSPRVDGG